MRAVRGALTLLGLAGVAIGGWWLVPELPRSADVISFGGWILGPPVLSDLVLMPAVALIGWLGGRLPRWLRTPAVVALLLSGLLLAIAAPFLGRPGYRPDNPTLLDRNYPAGFAAFVLVIWAACVGWALVRRTKRREKG